jgi:hypothetical protein
MRFQGANSSFLRHYPLTRLLHFPDLQNLPFDPAEAFRDEIDKPSED